MELFFVAKVPLLSKIQTLSDKLLVKLLITTIVTACQKPNKQGLSSHFEQFFWSKTTFCILRNKYGFQIGNIMEKKTLF